MPSGRPRKLEPVRQRSHEYPALKIVPGHVAPCPKCPTGMLPATRRVWKEFFLSSVARAVDARADMPKLLRWIRYVDEYERCRAVFVKARLVKGSTGQPVLNPLGGYLATLEGHISRLETDFGLGPLNRMRLGLATGQAALTADELNRRFDASAEVVDVETADVELSEWEQA